MEQSGSPPQRTLKRPDRRKAWARILRRAQVAVRRSNLFQILEIGAVVAFLVMTGITWFVFRSQSDRGQMLPTELTSTLLVGTLVPAMAILVLLGRRLALQRAQEEIGRSGQLHVRLVFLFSLISAVPTLLVVIFASVLFQSGVEFWFSDKSRGLLENANQLALGYSEQIKKDMEYESLAMAQDLREEITLVPFGSAEFQEYYLYQVLHRKIDESTILQKRADGGLDKAAFTRGEAPLSEISADVLRQLDRGEAISVSSGGNTIRAITPIDRRAGIYLYTVRKSDLLSAGYAQNILRSYDELTQRTRIQQLRVNVALFVASLALVGLSVWFALRFADRQVKPLYDLVDAARQVGSGNFSMRVEGRTGADEVGLLNRAFNRMTQQLERQNQALLGANQQLDERRAFMEAVLESVTAGIISTNSKGEIQLMNGSAQKLLLERGAEIPIGVELAQIAPQIAALAQEGSEGGIVQFSKGNDLLTLAVKSTRSATGHVVTFEDITRQLVDQRQAAWSDVARRIAHEIKNPLTPIQLATERLKRRYAKQVVADGELFEELTGTIIRQVGDLRRMVDEFSSFARLPKPLFRGEDPVDLARQALFLQEVARPDINFSFAADADFGIIACDRHQFGQAMTNVLKNAVEAVEARQKQEDADYRGRISVVLTGSSEDVVVAVTDNGIGLPQEGERIIEPYVTTRDKGTGLGLAIVKKIVEEHGGDIQFTPGKTEGTVVTMRFARDPLDRQDKPEAAE
ncbi:ATP-binding protein [Novosphingobium sp.]|uniref:sensor histidine kinase n=1 Tax=Novosphingobium sp. TaxID=1874826 RepID=UPI00260089BC|nr:ATP-binding protein [Novosphingobium sp.]MCC6925541.1 HAMP domain-containing protein [Novosphingobium sp.]